MFGAFGDQKMSPFVMGLCDGFVTVHEELKVNKYIEKLSLYLYMSRCHPHPRAMPAYAYTRGWP